MKLRLIQFYLSASTLFAVGLVSSTTEAQAQTSIPIINFNFETGGLSDGQFSNNPGVIPSGWTSVSSITPAFYGYFNPTATSYTGTGGSGTTGSMSGPNVFYFGSAVGGEGIQQTLSSQFAADTNYTLTVATGTRISALGTTASLKMELLAGSTVLATSTVRNTTTDSFADFSVSYSFTSGESGLVGQSLVIRLTEIDTPGAGEVDIDNIRLTATAIPEPATSAVVAGALVMFGVILRRKRKRSVP